MTADMGILTARAELLAARIEQTEDPFLRDNLASDHAKILAQIQTLQESAA
ncbi:MAG: hypothetical protein H6524_08100 [Actinobacteria bacterium]|jgi:hypothetical protein|nr:hypothetical protein [Micrococcales bacterium]MCB0904728.1 hypothetical protein [Actinomycetota bacterium]MCO5298846.1 hypothetical protein [Candidatus Nanopelagicales bacterium]MCB9428755.1 hypothetical protein [Actinomycetota bacterium]HPE11771.1 hypothetical protein [Actinomycetota bacterium]